MKVIKYKKSFTEEKAEKEHKKAIKISIMFIFLSLLILSLIYFYIKYSPHPFVQKYGFYIFLLILLVAIFVRNLEDLADYYFFQRDVAEKGIVG